jgi:hypothetical protein
MNTIKVITYQSPRGAAIDLTPSQIKTYRKAGTWPKDSEGQKYCTVSHGLHTKHVSDDNEPA